MFYPPPLPFFFFFFENNSLSVVDSAMNNLVHDLGSVYKRNQPHWFHFQCLNPFQDKAETIAKVPEDINRYRVSFLTLDNPWNLRFPSGWLRRTDRRAAASAAPPSFESRPEAAASVTATENCAFSFLQWMRMVYVLPRKPTQSLPYHVFFVRPSQPWIR